MRKFFILLISVFFILPLSKADEGMWLPFLLKLNEKDMQSKGLKITAEDIYSINQGSLKDELKVRCGQYQVDLVETDINEGFHQVMMTYLLKRQKLF